MRRFLAMIAENGGLVKCSTMLGIEERTEIYRLWKRKVEQDEQGLSQADRHRNLEPPSAEFIHALAAGIGAKRILEVGGSSGISTIALAAAAKQTSGRLVSIEMEPLRQQDAQQTLSRLDLAQHVDFIRADAATVV